jgi:hypothetical protein
MPSKVMDIDAIIVAAFRVRRNSSFNHATTTSSTEIVDVSAARLNNPKNITAKITPPGIALKTLGSTSKTSPGPGDRSETTTLKKQILQESPLNWIILQQKYQ